MITVKGVPMVSMVTQLMEHPMTVNPAHVLEGHRHPISSHRRVCLAMMVNLLAIIVQRDMVVVAANPVQLVTMANLL